MIDKAGFAPGSQLPENSIGRNSVLPMRFVWVGPLKTRNDKFMGSRSSFLPKSEPSLLEKLRVWVRGPLYSDSYQTETFSSAFGDSLIVLAGGLSVLGLLFLGTRHFSLGSKPPRSNNVSSATTSTSSTAPQAISQSTGTTKPTSLQSVKHDLSRLQTLPSHQNNSQFVSKVTAAIKKLSFDDQKALLRDSLLYGHVKDMYVSGHDNVLIKALFTGLSVENKKELLSTLSEGARGSGLLHELTMDTQSLDFVLAGLNPEQKKDLFENQHVMHFTLDAPLQSIDTLLTGLTANQIKDILNIPYDVGTRRVRRCADQQTVLDALKERTCMALGLPLNAVIEDVMRLRAPVVPEPSNFVYYHRYRMINGAADRARKAPGGRYQAGTYQVEARNDTDRLGYSQTFWEKNL